VITDAHHAVPVERPEEFNAVVTPFLEQASEGSNLSS